MTEATNPLRGLESQKKFRFKGAALRRKQPLVQVLVFMLK